jgi:hypothetical protein
MFSAFGGEKSGLFALYFQQVVSFGHFVNQGHKAWMPLVQFVYLPRL